MKIRILWLLLFLSPLFGACSDDTTKLAVSYDHAGLTRVEIKNSNLTFTWHTTRKWDGEQQPQLAQSIESYDRHEILVRLTRKELQRFQSWVEKSDFSRFTPPFPNRGKDQTYGSAFVTKLAVELNDKKHSLQWNGDSRTPPELEQAVKELVEICRELEQRRRPEK